MELLIAILIIVGVLVIAGVGLLVGRGRGGRSAAPPAPARPAPRDSAPPLTATGGEAAVDDTAVDDTAVDDTAVDDTRLEELDAAQLEELELELEARPSFRDRLAKARGTIAGYLGSVLSRSAIDDETWDELEEALIRADVGVATTTTLLDELRQRVAAEGIKEPSALLEALKADLKSKLGGRDLALDTAGEPAVWLFVGVNGVGKTTTIGKLARREVGAGHSVVLAAGDTFRAAAAEQLEMWAKRADAEIVRGAEGADPSSVIFDGIEHAAARGADLVLADTAGRLHTKSNLMDELRKVRRVADKGAGTVTEVLLVLDATTGQNGLVQAQQFTDAVEVTGVVLTKLDGSAKGGIVFAVQTELDIPVKLVGLGEGADDLVTFDADEFVEALFAT